ncbi:ABC transporter substrate-binding protein [Natronobacterium texcoconense]|uniref:ABC-type branched-chain amino acid transport system, substrate-binding protein n=1 Tax=Natronobacterium texcoconense TaxID=1095778 RepID=A0A1H1BLA8_NATTX|nr:ABC transporter substrate-binding protein [Natronobacterium texcoconense]SDQ52707.1 ABC-type branched-chain amino acid transport system, substrate-binding protein [Natronobacterium texcoconense]
MAYNVSRRRVLAGIGAGTALSVAGCLDEEDVEAGTGDEDSPDAMVGVLQPVTGDLGNLGAPIRDAAILPAQQLEDEGVDFEIDIREEDTESEPEPGISGAQSLVDAGYPSITGAAASPVTIAAAEDVFFPNEAVAISPASTSPDITDMEGDYLLRTCPTDALQGPVMAEIAFEEEGYETASTLYLNQDYGQGLNDAFVEEFESLGGEVLEEVAFEPEQPSYSSELESTLADDPDILLVVGYPDSGEQIFRDFYSDTDGETPIIVPDGLQDESLPAGVDNPMENVFGTAPAAAGPGAETFTDLFESEYGSEPGVFTAQAYDATAIHILAQLRAGELSGPAISEQVREVTDPGGELVTPENLAEGLVMAADGDEIEYQGASGEVVFDENGDLEAATYDIFEYHMDGYDVTDQHDF